MNLVGFVLILYSTKHHLRSQCVHLSNSKGIPNMSEKNSLFYHVLYILHNTRRRREKYEMFTKEQYKL